MTKKSDGLTRRAFLGTSATLVGAAALAGCDSKKTGKGAVERGAAGKVGERALIGGDDKVGSGAIVGANDETEAMAAPAAGELPDKSTVVLIRDAAVMDKNRQVDAAVIAAMLDSAVTTLVGQADARQAWAQLIKPDDTVGIKTNEWRFLRTPLALEAALRQRVEGAGVAAERISVRDRRILKDPIFTSATALINVRPMRTHHWSGVGTCIKNYILFHPVPSDWHDNSCADLAGIWELPLVKGKTRLNILVMLSPLFHGKGPHHYHAEYTWDYKGMIVGFDPVAVDATGVRVLEAKRRAHFAAAQPFDTPVTHLEVAQNKYKLGNADPAKIEVIKMGWQDGVLI